MDHGFWSVCVASSWVQTAKACLAGAPVKVCAVIGFPLGSTATKAKSAETAIAVVDGADELDMVVNLGALKSGDLEAVTKDISEVVAAANGRTVKVILETCYLTDAEKRAGAAAAVAGGGAFVKTSTGFGPGGATTADVALLRSVVGPSIGVKASGGIRDLETARSMILAGANRLGTSSGIAIVRGLSGSADY